MKLKTEPLQFRAIAKIIKAFGIRGEVKIYSYARSADEYKKLPDCFLGANEQTLLPCSVEAVRVRGEDLCLKLKGIDERNSAEDIVGKFLFVKETDRKKLSDGSYFIDELVGCKVFHSDGRLLGTVKSVDMYPSSAMYVVQTAKGEVLMPGVNEIVREVNVNEKIIRVLPPEGLFDGEML